MNVVHILPNLRKGLSTRISGQNGLRATFDVNVQMSGHRAGEEGDAPTPIPGKDANSPSLSRPFLLAGPVDVRSISRDPICQVVPEDKCTGYSNGYMPYIEFYDEDFPWRYTPLESSEKLVPWLLLLACKDGEFKVEFDAQGNYRVTVDLDAAGVKPEDFYPSKDQFHMAAHVQITAPEDVSDLLNYVKDNPDDGVSRLFCLRTMEAYTQYHLFLVPAFELGRLAGLGQTGEIPAGVGARTLSWEDGATKKTFPVYYQWSYKTGAEKFMDLADKQHFMTGTEFAALSPGLKADIRETGLRDYRIKYPKTDDTRPIDIPVALVKQGHSEADDKREAAVMDNELKGLLVKSPVFSDDDPEHPVYEDPWVVPPVYGARHILAKPVDLNKSSLFLKDLNLRFSNRAAAGMGAQVVKKNQEMFMNRAWGMVEEVNALNQRVREFYQVLKTNGAADTKVTALRHYEFPTAVLGLQTDAAIRIANAQSAADINAIDLANDVIGERLNVMTSAMGDYTLGAGLSWSQAEDVINPDNWDSKKQVILKQGHPYKFYTGEVDFFSDDKVDPKYRFLKELLDIDRGKITITQNGATVTPHQKSKDFFQFLFKENIIRLLPSMDTDLGFDDGWKAAAWSPSCQITFDAGTDVSDVPHTIQDLIDMLEKAQSDYDDRWATFNDSVISSFRQASLPIFIRIDGDNYSYRGVLLKEKAYKSVFPYTNPDGVYFEYHREDADQAKRIPIDGRFFILPEKSLYEDSIWKYYKGYDISFLSEEFRIRHQIPLKHVPNSKYFEVDSGSDFPSKLDPIVLEGGRVKVTGSSGAQVGWWLLSDTIDNWLYSARGIQTMERLAVQYETQKLRSFYQCPFYRLVHKVNSSNMTDYSIYLFYKDGHLWLVRIYGNQDSRMEEFAADKKLCWEENGQVKVNLDLVKDMVTKGLERLKWFNSIMWRPNYIQCEATDLLAKTTRVSADMVAGITGTAADAVKREIDSVYEAVVHQVENLSFTIGIEKRMAKASHDSLFKELFQVQSKSTVDADEINRERLIDLAKELSSRKMSMDLMESNFDGKYPVMAAPLFPDPTSFYLRELSEKYILPSADELKMNSISCFVTNPVFEEAFLAGMNTEMGRELLWREYPTDERGSCFRKFWDQNVLPEDFAKGYFDIKYMHNWKGRLGENHEEGKGRMTVFVIKSELMTQYPQTAVCLAQKVEGDVPLKVVLRPAMTGWLSDDTFMAGFYVEKLPSTEGIYLTFMETDKSQRFSRERPKVSGKYPAENVSSEFAVHRRDNGSVWGKKIDPKYLEQN